MRLMKKCVVVAIMGIMVAMAAEHEAHAGCIGHGAASGYDLDAVTGPGVRTVYMDELPDAWTPESFITLEDGGCVVIEGAEKDGHIYTRTRGNDGTTWTIDGMVANVCPRMPAIPGVDE